MCMCIKLNYDFLYKFILKNCFWFIGPPKNVCSQYPNQIDSEPPSHGHQFFFHLY